MLNIAEIPNVFALKYTGWEFILMLQDEGIWTGETVALVRIRKQYSDLLLSFITCARRDIWLQFCTTYVFNVLRTSILSSIQTVAFDCLNLTFCLYNPEE